MNGIIDVYIKKWNVLNSEKRTFHRFLTTSVYFISSNITTFDMEFTATERGQRSLITCTRLLVYTSEKLGERLYLLGMRFKKKRALQSKSKAGSE